LKSIDEPKVLKKFYYINNFEIKKIIRLKDNKDFYYLMQNYL